MTPKEKIQKDAETFVERVLKETFKQEASPEEVRAVAKKVSRTIPTATANPRHLIAAE